MPQPSGLELRLLIAALSCFALASLAYIALVTLRPSSEGAKSGLGMAGTGFALLAAFVLTAWLVHRGLSTGHAPYANLYEYVIAFAWGVAAVYLVLERIYHVRALGALAMPVGLLLSLYCLLLPSAQKVGVKDLMPALKSPWLAVHVGTAVLAYGAFAVGFAAGIAYLLRGFSSMARGVLPQAELLDRVGYRAISFGFPMLTLMVFTGAIWADRAWGRYWGWDPKETWSLVTWLVYLGYLHARLVMGWRGTRAAWLATLGFVAVIFTLFGVNYLSTASVHAYR